MSVERGCVNSGMIGSVGYGRVAQEPGFEFQSSRFCRNPGVPVFKQSWCRSNTTPRKPIDLGVVLTQTDELAIPSVPVFAPSAVAYRGKGCVLWSGDCAPRIFWPLSLCLPAAILSGNMIGMDSNKIKDQLKATPEQELVVGPLVSYLISVGWKFEQIVFGKKEWVVPKTPSDATRRERRQSFSGFPVDVAIFDDPVDVGDPSHLLVLIECKQPYRIRRCDPTGVLLHRRAACDPWGLGQRCYSEFQRCVPLPEPRWSDSSEKPKSGRSSAAG